MLFSSKFWKTPFLEHIIKYVLLAVSSKTIDTVRKRMVDSRKQFEEKHVSGF